MTQGLKVLAGVGAVTVLVCGLMAQASDKTTEQTVEKVKLGTGSLLQGIPGEGPLTLKDIQTWLANPKNHVVLEPELPLGLSAAQQKIVGLRENPLTRAKIELGRQLYFDTRLSADNTVSCASCHHPDEGYGRQTRFGVGINGQEGNRNSPVSFNRILSGAQFWDGRASSLEEQAIGPIANPIEMGHTHIDCVAGLQKIPGYVAQFESIFGSKMITIEKVGQAIAAFERCLVTGPSAYDYADRLQAFARLSEEDLADLKTDDPETYKTYEELIAGAKAKPMSESARRGRDLFFSERANCTACHAGANFTDEQYHNLGVGMDQPMPDYGRFEVTKLEKDRGAFKTPTIRNIAQTAPYMHDGSEKTLMDVVEYYDKGGNPNPWLSDKMKPLRLTLQEKKDLVAFMEACTGDFPAIESGRLP